MEQEKNSYISKCNDFHEEAFFCFENIIKVVNRVLDRVVIPNEEDSAFIGLAEFQGEKDLAGELEEIVVEPLVKELFSELSNFEAGIKNIFKEKEESNFIVKPIAVDNPEDLVPFLKNRILLLEQEKNSYIFKSNNFDEETFFLSEKIMKIAKRLLDRVVIPNEGAFQENIEILENEEDSSTSDCSPDSCVADY